MRGVRLFINFFFIFGYKKYMDITIRKEKESDIDKVFAIHKTTFPQTKEAELVDELRKAPCDIISLVAATNNDIAVGHVMLSPVYIDGQLSGMGLAPLSVLPQYQNQGIGTKLTKIGIQEAIDKNYKLITVIGSPSFYNRFGFVCSSKYGLKSQYDDIAEENFMALSFDNKHWNNKTVIYRNEFEICE